MFLLMSRYGFCQFYPLFAAPCFKARKGPFPARARFETGCIVTPAATQGSSGCILQQQLRCTPADCPNYSCCVVLQDCQELRGDSMKVTRAKSSRSKAARGPRPDEPGKILQKGLLPGGQGKRHQGLRFNEGGVSISIHWPSPVPPSPQVGRFNEHNKQRAGRVQFQVLRFPSTSQQPCVPGSSRSAENWSSIGCVRIPKAPQISLSHCLHSRQALIRRGLVSKTGMPRICNTRRAHTRQAVFRRVAPQKTKRTKHAFLPLNTADGV